MDVCISADVVLDAVEDATDVPTEVHSEIFSADENYVDTTKDVIWWRRGQHAGTGKRARQALRVQR